MHVERNNLDLIGGTINTSARRDHGKHNPQPQYSVPGPDLNPGRDEFKAAVLTTRLVRSEELPRDLGVSTRGPYVLRLTLKCESLIRLMWMSHTLGRFLSMATDPCRLISIIIDDYIVSVQERVNKYIGLSYDRYATSLSIKLTMVLMVLLVHNNIIQKRRWHEGWKCCRKDCEYPHGMVYSP
jgi:hypothetical protein